MTKDISIENAKKDICFFYNISLEQLKKGKRKRSLADKTHIYLYFSYKYIEKSLTFIAEDINYDHSIFHHVIKKCNNKYELKYDFERFVIFMKNKYDLKVVDRQKIKAYHYRSRPNKRSYKRAVKQYTEVGNNLVSIYESITEAAKQTNLNYQSILKSCKKSGYCIKGYNFIYES